MIDKKLRDHQNCCSSSWRGPWMSVPNSMAIHPNFVKTVPSKPSTNVIRFNPLGTMNVCTTHRGTPSNRHGWSSQYTPSELFVRCLNSCSVILNVTCRDLKDLHPGLGFVYEDLKTAQNYTDTHTHVLQVEGNVPSSPQGQCEESVWADLLCWVMHSAARSRLLVTDKKGEATVHCTWCMLQIVNRVSYYLLPVPPSVSYQRDGMLDILTDSSLYQGNDALSVAALVYRLLAAVCCSSGIGSSSEV